MEHVSANSFQTSVFHYQDMMLFTIDFCYYSNAFFFILLQTQSSSECQFIFHAHGIALRSLSNAILHSLQGVDSIHWLQIVQLVATGLHFSFPVPFFLHCQSGDCNLKGGGSNARNDVSQLLGRHLASMLFAQLDSRAWLHSSLRRRSSSGGARFLPLNSLLLELLEIPPS